jgi:tyrosyl-tRNA synthetase
MQGYDSVMMDVDGEVGGNDQLFNMLAGRTLIKQMKNKEKFVLTVKLLEDGTGKKMGKSEGNMISLVDSPQDIYGKIMSWPDSLIVIGFELCTDYSMVQIENIKKELGGGINPRDIKMRLAHEITKICTDEKLANRAQETFISTFQKKESVDDVKQATRGSRTFETICIEEGLVESKSELRRLIQDGAIMNFDTKEKMVDLKSKEIPELGVYKIGKNRFIKIV